MAALTEISPPLSFDEIALALERPSVEMTMEPASTVAFPPTVAETVASAHASEVAVVTLMAPPPPPVAEAETIWSPPMALNGTDWPMPSSFSFRGPGPAMGAMAKMSC